MLRDNDNYDFRKWDWFIMVLINSGFIILFIYIFKGIGEVGFIYSCWFENNQVIIGLDVFLVLLLQFLIRQNLLSGSQVIIINFYGEVIVSLFKDFLVNFIYVDK